MGARGAMLAASRARFLRADRDQGAGWNARQAAVGKMKDLTAMDQAIADATSRLPAYIAYLPTDLAKAIGRGCRTSRSTTGPTTAPRQPTATTPATPPAKCPRSRKHPRRQRLQRQRLPRRPRRARGYPRQHLHRRLHRRARGPHHSRAVVAHSNRSVRQRCLHLWRILLAGTSVPRDLPPCTFFDNRYPRPRPRAAAKPPGTLCSVPARECGEIRRGRAAVMDIRGRGIVKPLSRTRDGKVIGEQ